jgi:hypothetical protein
LEIESLLKMTDVNEKVSARQDVEDQSGESRSGGSQSNEKPAIPYSEEPHVTAKAWTVVLVC